MKRKKFSFKNLKLASKTAFILGFILLAVFIVFIGITIGVVRSALVKSIDSEFSNMCEKNAMMIQAPIDNAEEIAIMLQDYMEKKYAEYESIPMNGTQRSEKEDSSVYSRQISRFYREVEDFMIHTITTRVENNDDIAGVGVLFERDAFDNSIRDYSIYISETDLDNPTSLGAYEDYSQEEYYEVAKETKEPYFTKPFEFEGNMMISCAYPIIYNGKVMGIVTADVNVTRFNQIVREDSRYPTMYQDIVTDDATIVFDSTDLSGGNINVNFSEWMTDENFQKMLDGFAAGEAFVMEDKNVTGTVIQRYCYPIEAGNTLWWAITGVDKPDKESELTTTLIIMIILMIVVLVVMILATTIILRKFINPIGKVVAAAEQIAEGHFDIRLESQANDEIGILTRSFALTSQRLKEVIEDISRTLGAVAGGDLTVETQGEYAGDLSRIKDSVNDILNNLNEFMEHVSETSGQVSGGSEQIASGAQSLAEGSTEQASSIQELQATVMEIVEQVVRNADYALEASRTAKVAGEELDEGNRQMKRMVEAMQQISQASNNIKDVIKTIEDIAEQTNLLSLNASIEAARAGEAGRGFAVVADQVGKLAQESAEATKVTARLIEESLDAVNNGIAISDDTAEVIEKTVDKVQTVIGNVEGIAAASESQKNALEQVKQGVEQISGIIQENSALAEESASASQELSAQAVVLDEIVGKFEIKRR